MVDLTIAISTFEDRIYNLISWEFDQRLCYLIVWQNPSNLSFDSAIFPNNVELVCISTYGVANSRNFALNCCKTKWIWFMDDDVHIPNESTDILIHLLPVYDESSILIASVNFGHTIPIKRFTFKSKSIFSFTSVGTIQIICSAQRALESNSFFPVNMGAGSKYPVCDEPVFLLRMIRNAQVSLCGITDVIVNHPPDSSGVNLSKSENLISRAMFFKEAFGFPLCLFVSACFFVKHCKKIKWKFIYLFYFLSPN
jgi:hypothetical protein